MAICDRMEKTRAVLPDRRGISQACWSAAASSAQATWRREIDSHCNLMTHLLIHCGCESGTGNCLKSTQVLCLAFVAQAKNLRKGSRRTSNLCSPRR